MAKPLESTGARLTIFVTGGSGFVGRRLLARLAALPQCQVRALVRQVPSEANPAIRWVEGDLLTPASYERHLEGVEQVIHLGAAVGRCRRAVYFAVNDLATGQLLERCRAAGVPRFLFVSTIAVRYSDLAVYPYAESKLLAEQRVRNSGLAFQIVRPTIVLGDDGPSWQSLAKLASLPFTPVFGSGQNRLQPIDVDDLVDCLIALSASPIEEPVIELGGPEITTMSDFLRRIHQHTSSRPFRPWRWPLPLARAMARGLEASLGHRAPITRGQLSVFANDSTVIPSDFLQRRHGQLRPLDELIARAATVRVDASSCGDSAALQQECCNLSRYLFGGDPSSGTWHAYRLAHQQRTIDESMSSDWDRRLVQIARRHPWLCPAIDSYCRFFAPGALLRRKLVLLLAASEWEPSLSNQLQLDRPVTAPLVGGRIVVRLVVSGLLSLVALVCLTPLKWLAPKTDSRPAAGD